MKKIYELSKRQIDNNLKKEIEIYLSKYNGFEIVIESNKIRNVNYIDDEEIAIKAGTKNNMGFYYSTSFDDNLILEGIEEAISIGKVAHMSMPLTEYSDNNSYFDKTCNKKNDYHNESNIALKHIRNEIIKLNNIYPHLIIDSLKVSNYTCDEILLNNYGVEITQSEDKWVIDGLFLCSDETLTTPFNIMFDSADHLEDLDLERYIARIDNFPIRYVNDSDTYLQKKYKVLLSPYAVYQLIVEPIIKSCSVDNIINNESLFFENNKLKDFHISKYINIIDDNCRKGFLNNRKYDREGNSICKSYIIKEGVISTILSNNLNKGMVDFPQINRAGGKARDINIIEPTNIIMEGGIIDSKNLLADIDCGILVERFSGTINKMGNIIGVLRPTYLIVDGEVKGLCKEVLVFGNLKEILENIINISSNVIKYGNIELPYVLLSRI